MYFDEEVVLDVRLNVLDQFVDYFVIVESRFTHKGDPRDLKFDLQKFNRFKDKIIYLIYEDQPKEVKIVKKEDGIFEKFHDFTTSTNQKIDSFSSAFSFTLFHDGIHLGSVLAIRKFV